VFGHLKGMGFQHAEALEQRLCLSVFTVTSAADSGPGSLREAIAAANASPGADQINFNIDTGPQTIALASRLPTITDQLTIDGTTQSGFSSSPLIAIDGSRVDGDGLRIAAGGCLIRGLAIDGFTGGAGVNLLSNNNIVAGNYIGPDLTGTAAGGNYAGVLVTGSGNLIGGATAGAGNVISGNGVGIIVRGAAAVGNAIQGNLIGTTAAGNAALPNNDGLHIDSNTLIGGTSPLARNVISGNLETGLSLNSKNTVIGNYIGTDISGAAPLPNQGTGIMINGSGNVIGGASIRLANTIAFNGATGVQMSGGTGNLIRNNIISANRRGGIAMANGVNRQQVSPVLQMAAQRRGVIALSGRVYGPPKTAMMIDFYANNTRDPSGLFEGQRYIGSATVMTDASGRATFRTQFRAAANTGRFITATATTAGADTSPFSSPAIQWGIRLKHRRV